MVDLESGTGTNIDEITVANGKLSLELKSTGLKFEGTLGPSGSEIKGKFTQGETSGDLTLTRSSEKNSNVADGYQKREYMIPMRDGIHLHTIVFSPKSPSEALPFLIERTPYGWDGAVIDINTGMSRTRPRWLLSGLPGHSRPLPVRRPVRTPATGQNFKRRPLHR